LKHSKFIKHKIKAGRLCLRNDLTDQGNKNIKTKEKKDQQR